MLRSSKCTGKAYGPISAGPIYPPAPFGVFESFQCWPEGCQQPSSIYEEGQSAVAPCATLHSSLPSTPWQPIAVWKDTTSWFVMSPVTTTEMLSTTVFTRTSALPAETAGPFAEAELPTYFYPTRDELLAGTSTSPDIVLH